MKRFWGIVFLPIMIQFTFGQSSSTSSHLIDRQLDTCISRNPSMLGMIGCYTEGQKAWEAEMNKVYYQLLSYIQDASLQNLLKEEQSAWEKMRTLENSFEEKFYAQIGSEWLVVAASARTDAVRQRTFRLKEYLYLQEKKSQK